MRGAGALTRCCFGAGALMLSSAASISASIITVDPADFADYAVLDNAVSGVSLSVHGPWLTPTTEAHVVSLYDVFYSRTATLGSITMYTPTWAEQSLHLRADFAAPTTWVSFDFVKGAYPESLSMGELRAFDEHGNLVGSAQGLFDVQVAYAGGIAYATAWATLPHPTHVTLERLRFESAPVPEPGSLALIGAGLAGLGVLRRRTPSAAGRAGRRT